MEMNLMVIRKVLIKNYLMIIINDSSLRLSNLNISMLDVINRSDLLKYVYPRTAVFI